MKKALVVFLLSISCFFTIVTYVQSAEWTYMVYIGGDNNLSQAGIADIEEMKNATSNANVNCVVQVECSPNYSFALPNYMQAGYITYRLFIANGTVTPLSNIGNVDMGNPDTLKDFIQWAAKTYPASKYALTIWDHGDGWKKGHRNIKTIGKGAVQDETSGSFMSLTQLGNAVRQSNVYFNLIDFDACLMAMYEVAYEFVGLANYMVFAEEVEPGNGNPYTPILNKLYSDPFMDGNLLSKIITSDFVNSYRGTRNSVTKSSVDLSQFAELYNKINQLSSLMISSIAIDIPAYANARSGTQQYFSKSNIDLVHFLDRLSVVGGTIGDKATEIANFIKQNVVISNDFYSSSATEGGTISAPNVDNSNGLAIFFPTLELLHENELSAYDKLSSNNSSTQSSWSQFLTEFITASGGNPQEGGGEYVDGGFAFAALWLDDYGNFSDADVDLFVMEPDNTIGACWIGSSTSNGYFSPDSFSSGNSYEMYGAKDKIMPGTYLYILNYNSNGYINYSANVYLFFMDPLQGINTWTAVPSLSKNMNLFNPAPPIWTEYDVALILQGYYSDWWIPATTQRALSPLSFEEKKNILLKVKAMSYKRRGNNNTINLLNLYETFTR